MGFCSCLCDALLLLSTLVFSTLLSTRSSFLERILKTFELDSV